MIDKRGELIFLLCGHLFIAVCCRYRIDGVPFVGNLSFGVAFQSFLWRHIFVKCGNYVLQNVFCSPPHSSENIGL